MKPNKKFNEKEDLFCWVKLSKGKFVEQRSTEPAEYKSQIQKADFIQGKMTIEKEGSIWVKMPGELALEIYGPQMGEVAREEFKNKVVEYRAKSLSRWAIDRKLRQG